MYKSCILTSLFVFGMLSMQSVELVSCPKEKPMLDQIPDNCKSNEDCSRRGQGDLCCEYCDQILEACYLYCRSSIKPLRDVETNCISKSPSFTLHYRFTRLHHLITSINIKIGVFNFSIDDTIIELQNSQLLNAKQFKKPDFKFLHFNASEGFFWISVNALEAREVNGSFIKFGIGYSYTNNTVFEFKPSNRPTFDMIKRIKEITIDSRVEIKSKLCENRIVAFDLSPIVIENPTWDQIGSDLMTPKKLPREGQILFSIINSRNLEITEEEAAAINYSLDNKGCLLNKKISDKAEAFGSKNTSYLRVTFDDTDGSSPGQPYVLEIWPSGHFSPVHNHGKSIAVIKMLHGELKTEWFNPLADPVFNEEPVAVKTGFLKKGDITWMTPNYFQTHKLTNQNKTTAAISLQMYAHLSSAEKFEEVFYYVIPGDGQLKKFFPKSDFIFKGLRSIVLNEYTTKRCGVNTCNCNLNGSFCGYQLEAILNNCKTPFIHNSVYSCDTKTGKFSLKENCSLICDDSNFSAAKCQMYTSTLVEIKPGRWSNVSGSISIEEKVDGLVFRGVVNGLKPESYHGFHIHERGDTSNQCSNVGFHFDPLKIGYHGAPNDEIKHFGDLGNIKTDAYGSAVVNIKVGIVNLKSRNLFYINGKSLAVHAFEDDHGKNKNEMSKVDGNSGPIVGCGKISKEEKIGSKIDWQNGSWAFSCDFRINSNTIDLIYVESRRDDCGAECKKRKNCTHYTWTLANNGTCWLMSGNISNTDAYNTNDNTMICGIIESYFNTSFNCTRTFEFVNGDRYEGEFKNGIKNGRGTIYFKNGSRYEGEWKDDKRNGHGTFYWADGGKWHGDRYDGEYKDDKRHGRGTYYWANGNRYEGEFKDGLKNGSGTFYWANGNRYEGEFTNDSRNGRGIFYWVNGNKYNGEWKENNMHGHGTYYWADGNRYEGEWRDSYMDGRGTYFWTDGNKYEGEWRNDNMNGRGTYYFVNGARYEGEWKDWKKHGPGTLIKTSGDRISQNWHMGNQI